MPLIEQITADTTQHTAEQIIDALDQLAQWVKDGTVDKERAEVEATQLLVTTGFDLWDTQSFRDLT
jgi:alkylhydroperoxidase family enzyme